MEFVITDEEVEEIKGLLNNHSVLHARNILDILDKLKPLDKTQAEPKINKQEEEKMAEDTPEESTEKSTEETTEESTEESTDSE